MVDPWGRVLSDAGEIPAVTVETLDFSAISKARGAIPSLGNTAGDDISLKMF
jgi:predicted amidohydrolase